MLEGTSSVKKRVILFSALWINYNSKPVMYSKGSRVYSNYWAQGLKGNKGEAKPTAIAGPTAPTQPSKQKEQQTCQEQQKHQK